MNKKLILLLILLVLVGLFISLVSRSSQGKYLVLKTGEVIPVKYIIVEENIIFYEKAGETLFSDKTEIKDVLEGSLKGVHDIMKRISCYLQNGGRIISTGWLSILFVIFAGAAVISFFKRKEPVQKIAEASRMPEDEDDTIITPPTEYEGKDEKMMPVSMTRSIRKKAGPVGIPEIEEYFLNVFRIQLGASCDDPARIEVVSKADANLKKIYRLHIQVNGIWKSRGMSIAPLGEDTESKSACYYVIYDTHMVVKIPSKPIATFSDYIRSIRNEGRIVRKLAPRECIIPNLSVIMNKFRLMSGIGSLPAEQLEYKYRVLLETSPEYHEYLKISGDFAFYMNLSRYYFLSHVMKHLHDTEEQIRDMITADAGFILDCQGFEYKYGPKNTWICFELQRIFRQFDKGLHELGRQTGNSTSISAEQKKNWLFAHLTLQDLSDHQTGLSDRMTKEIENLLYDLTDSETEVVLGYRKLVREFAKIRLFKGTLPRIEGIITNLLGLLVWMGEKEVAMRDLKPDNLFVAGDPDNYPQFLSSAGEYAIGLIDLETAVDCRPESNLAPEQPSLGGTPAYATPSHFFSNTIIRELYEDLPTVLHFQDWYAVIAIIYEVVTGTRLFSQTAKRIISLVNSINASIRESSSMEITCREESRLFWKIAIEEFEKNVRKNEKWLKFAKPFIPEGLRHQLKIHLLNEALKTDQLVRSCVEGEKIFQKTESVEDLISCSHEELVRYIEKYKASGDASMKEEGEQQQLIEALEDLGDLKKRAANHLELLGIFNNPSHKMPVKSLMELMFNMVVSTMYPATWKPLSRAELRIEVEEAKETKEDKEDVPEGATIMASIAE